MNWSEESCFQYPARDAELFAKWTEGLPLRAPETPFHVGPHSLISLRMAYNLVSPKRLLEIGFCVGFSSTCWLNLGVERVVSMYISRREQTMEAVEFMENKWGNRFEFIHRAVDGSDFDYIKDRAAGYDAAFVDGAHDTASVSKDIELCIRLGIKRLYFDDWIKTWGDGVQEAIAKHRLIHVGVWGNIALCITPDGWGDL